MARDRLELLRDRPWRELTPPRDVVQVPTMLTQDEQALLYALARDVADGNGAIVDAGCFLGGSTAALLAGVRDRPGGWSGPPVASYDLFAVEQYTIDIFFSHDPSIRVGDSFRRFYDRTVAAFDTPHVTREGDIGAIGWDGGPIDILFLDVLKSWETHDAVLRHFYPSLVPGRSVIVHQDYGYGYFPWIAIGLELMRESVELVDAMENGSHVFFLKNEIPTELIEHGVRNLDFASKFALIEQAADRASGWVRGMMEIARVALVVERHGYEAGRRELDAIAARYSNEPFVQLCVGEFGTHIPSPVVAT